MKTCTMCHEEKDELLDFYKNNGECKKCHNNKRNLWRSSRKTVKRISDDERELIKQYLLEGRKQKKIAEMLNRSDMTISRIKKDFQKEGLVF